MQTTFTSDAAGAYAYRMMRYYIKERNMPLKQADMMGEMTYALFSHGFLKPTLIEKALKVGVPALMLDELVMQAQSFLLAADNAR